jgi:hypothetical protein
LSSSKSKNPRLVRAGADWSVLVSLVILPDATNAGSDQQTKWSQNSPILWLFINKLSFMKGQCLKWPIFPNKALEYISTELSRQTEGKMSKSYKL